MNKKLKMIKKEMRIIGIEEGDLRNNWFKGTLIIGVIFRGGLFFDGLVTSMIDTERFDASEEIAKMIVGSRYFDELRIAMFPKLIFGKSNALDPKRFYEKVKLPIIVITKKECEKDIEKFMSRESYEVLKRIDEHKLFKVNSSSKPFKVKFYGIEEEDAIKILKASWIRNELPEPLRVAKILIEAIEEFKEL
ncbi:MAG: DUF99 family protein [Candidatus Bathyarchaeia archaeon]